MRSLFYLAHRYPVVTETFTINEVRSLRARGLDVEVRTLREPPDDLPDELEPLAREGQTILPFDGVTQLPMMVLRAPYLAVSAVRPRRAIAMARGLALAGKLHGAHVHAQFPLDACSAGLYAARASGATFSFSGHTLHQLDLMREKLTAASFVTVGSEFERAVLCERYGDRWGERIHVRRLGVPPREASAQREPGLIVSAGTLAGKKGHDVLIRAVARLNSGIRLELVGSGPDRPALEALVRSLGLESRVTFRGPLGYSATLETIGRASAFALCCRRTADGDHDCLPVALMDAMSLGVPCVSSRAFGIPELIVDGESGLLADPEDDEAVAVGLDRLLTDDTAAESLRTAGRAVVRERFDLETNMTKLAELFSHFLAT